VKKSIPLVAASFATLLLVSGCNIGAVKSKGFGDASVDQANINDTSAAVIEFSDKYPDIEDKCDGHGHRIFVNTRGSGYFIVITDPTCPVGPSK
jgi:hypothetical protein